MLRITALSFFIILSSMSGCNRETQQHPEKVEHPEQYNEQLLNVNKGMVAKESEEIENYIKRHNWQMQSTGTGLRYQIYQQGSGEAATIGKIAVLKYTLNLLDGTECYSSEKTGPKEFRIGKGGVESGLEEGIKLLKVGDKAKFIFPPHLAHGLTGDDDKIPARATLIYDVELVQLK
jgi:FKBP-type peptidyl-prolyl cis-trans isomerase